MSENNNRPIITSGVYPIEGAVGYHKDGYDLRMEEDGQIINKILSLVNGLNSKKDIAEHIAQHFRLEKSSVEGMITELESVGLIIDGSSQHIPFHQTTKNPSIFYRDLSPQEIKDITNRDDFCEREGKKIRFNSVDIALSSLLKERISCRSFSDEHISMDDVQTILGCAYSKELSPIPSAGGLYPLTLYVLKKDENFKGHYVCYQYDHRDNSCVEMPGLFSNEFNYAFNSETGVFNADAVIVVCSNMNRHTEKYSNRGYRYSLLEAGHAAQNINLASTSLNIGSIEYGGFNDDALSEAINLPVLEEPIITIGLGRGSDRRLVTSLETSDKLNSLIGDEKPILYTGVDYSSDFLKRMGFYFAYAKFKKPNEAYAGDEHLYAGGTGQSIQEAMVKAVAEAYERYLGGAIRYDITHKSVQELGIDNVLDPREVRPLSRRQLNRLKNVSEFHNDMPIEWVEASRYPDKERIFVPIDLAFYPLNSEVIGRLPVAESDSSGMAAYTNLTGAIERATLELIERDVIMRNWFKKESPRKIKTEALPRQFQHRVNKISQNGRSVEVLDMTNDEGVIVINIIIRSSDYPYFVNGSAASNVSFEIAMQKALEEAELGLANALTEERIDEISPEDVRTPIDHGKLYFYDRFKDEIEWLWDGEVTGIIPYLEKKINLIDIYKPVVVRYTQDGDVLQVVRAICPQLVPISFGYNNEHYTHPSVGNHKMGNSTNIPHYFA